MWNNAGRSVILLLAGVLAACGGESPDAETRAVEAEPAGGMQGMEGMGDMGGMQMGGGMMEEMRAHMQSMQGETGERLVANLPRHRQMVANMLSQMNREMRDMNMAGDQEWDSAVEAVREDLRRLPEMSAPELEAFLPEHRVRVERLLDMHRDMMGGMRM